MSWIFTTLKFLNPTSKLSRLKLQIDQYIIMHKTDSPKKKNKNNG